MLQEVRQEVLEDMIPQEVSQDMVPPGAEATGATPSYFCKGSPRASRGPQGAGPRVDIGTPESGRNGFPWYTGASGALDHVSHENVENVGTEGGIKEEEDEVHNEEEEQETEDGFRRIADHNISVTRSLTNFVKPRFDDIAHQMTKPRFDRSTGHQYVLVYCKHHVSSVGSPCHFVWRFQMLCTQMQESVRNAHFPMLSPAAKRLSKKKLGNAMARELISVSASKTTTRRQRIHKR